MPRRVRPVHLLTLTPRKLTVKKVADVTPGMRRITLTGDQLAGYTVDGTDYPAFRSEGFDDPFKMFFPYPGETEPVLPIFEDGTVRFPKDPKPLARTYTVRRYDPETRELDVDFVKHGVGVACTWAYRAQPGDTAHIAGPPSTKPVPEGVDWFLVAGDETALPAIARLLDELPETAVGQVFIEVAEDEHRMELRQIPGITVTWLVRHGAATGENSLLLGALTDVVWQDGQVWAWIAGEQAVVRDMRRHLVEVRGVDKAWIDFTGYWRRQAVVALEDDAAVPDPEKNTSAFATFHEMAEILPPLALRAAANLDIGNLISRGTTGVDDLVAATGADEVGLRKFLRYLESLELLVPLGGPAARRTGYKLSDVGEILTSEGVLDHLTDDGVVATKERAFLGIEEAVRTGRPVFKTITGRSWTQQRLVTDFENKRLDQMAGGAYFMGTRLAGSDSVKGARDVVIHSDGAGALAAALVAALPEVRVVIPAMPTQAAWLKKDLQESIPVAADRKRVMVVEQTRFDSTTPADTIIIARELGNHADADAVMFLRRAAHCLTSRGRLLLVEPTFTIREEDGPDEHAAEADLLNLALVGGGNRTPEELDALVETAGLTVTATEKLGATVVRTVTRG
ncbi:MAG: SIP domain-containing protein [Corynebacterium nuruki]|nr:SIP domain-containing protein [Corynebacterium nuruki]